MKVAFRPTAVLLRSGSIRRPAAARQEEPSYHRSRLSRRQGADELHRFGGGAVVASRTTRIVSIQRKNVTASTEREKAHALSSTREKAARGGQSTPNGPAPKRSRPVQRSCDA